MDYRRRRQTIIVSILTLVLALLGTGGYFLWFYQAPTCFDDKQNQKEDGIDCGGPCAISCEALTIKNLRVEWTDTVWLKDNLYDAAAKVINDNPNYGLQKFSYTFVFFDRDGQLIDQRTGESFILPGQKKYVIEANIVLGVKPAIIQLLVGETSKNDWRRLKNDFEVPDIYVHDKQFKYMGEEAIYREATAQVSGIIKNNSDFDFNKINAAILLFDENRSIIGINKTEVYTVLAGEERYFSTLWFSPIEEVKSVDIMADTNLFADDNFMKRNAAPEKFQEYRPDSE